VLLKTDYVALGQLQYLEYGSIFVPERGPVGCKFKSDTDYPFP